MASTFDHQVLVADAGLVLGLTQLGGQLGNTDIHRVCSHDPIHLVRNQESDRSGATVHGDGTQAFLAWRLKRRLAGWAVDLVTAVAAHRPSSPTAGKRSCPRDRPKPIWRPHQLVSEPTRHLRQSGACPWPRLWLLQARSLVASRGNPASTVPARPLLQGREPPHTTSRSWPSPSGCDVAKMRRAANCAMAALDYL